MRITIYSIFSAALACSSAFCDEIYFPQIRLHNLSNFSTKYSFINYRNSQIDQKKGLILLSENSAINKFSRPIKKNTSPEGSVELIEMIKTAKSKKEASKSKN